MNNEDREFFHRYSLLGIFASGEQNPLLSNIVYYKFDIDNFLPDPSLFGVCTVTSKNVLKGLT